MEKYLDIFVQAYQNYGRYLWQEITFQTRPLWHNYFWMLVLVSGFFLALEWIRPWRKAQPKFRQDFWLDFFYLFFNFFLFSLLIYQASSEVVVNLFNDGIKSLTGFDLQASNPMRKWPIWAILLTGFVVRDFIQWWVHRLLHASAWLWEFHKVHHSVQQMGFAAHMRYHWMENVVYRTLEYVPLALLGIGLHDFFLIHIFTLAWGHYNHANFHVHGRITGGIVFGGALLFVGVSSGYAWWLTVILTLGGAGVGAWLIGPYMKRIFNSPDLHIWHHAYELPADRQRGVNFAITLAIWDYLWKTDYLPHDGRDIKLGFPGVEEYPHDFVGQNLHGIVPEKEE
ncbi:sterol desaturase family protein [Pontibacter sp. G13]|uniref:sterol desaturase family protein n=1 Tax=Pontibacter sp. G13 TaxID=3074898 RepID=UPI00288A8A45|nr:sterol desaturase family protein [Pontibacter sp. G13]WNJ19393.1 sterol desaturase family protein [Pontibacter sp. G13]